MQPSGILLLIASSILDNPVVTPVVFVSIPLTSIPRLLSRLLIPSDDPVNSLIISAVAFDTLVP